MERECVQIENSSSLVRDVTNRAVINTNRDEQTRIFALRAKKQQEAQELNRLKVMFRK